jgi:TetR/AcrR family transcriptional regulator, fatty acid metabolism regulator protein
MLRTSLAHSAPVSQGSEQSGSLNSCVAIWPVGQFLWEMVKNMNERSKEGMGTRSGRTFIEEARRKQIVQHAVDVIAEHGFAGATLARIAEHAGISKGVISYHFDGKDDLMYEVLTLYEHEEQEFIYARVEAEETASAALETYLRTNVEYMAFHPRHLKAVVEIVIAATDSNGKRKFDVTSVEWMEDELNRLISILRWGQESGEFRTFDSRVMAISIRGAIENLAMYILTYPNIDVSDYAAELTSMFMRATREDSG